MLPDGAGKLGNIDITTGSLQLTDNASVNSLIQGRGINDRGSGEITVNASDTVSIDNSTISSSAQPGGSGKGGDITISTGDLTLANNGSIFATTSGDGDAGGITIDARGMTSLNESSNISSSAFLVYDPNPSDTIQSRVVNPNISARGGNIVIRTGSLSLVAGSTIGADLAGIGQAGDITINVMGDAQLNNGSVSTATTGFDERLRLIGFDETLRSIGDAGDVTITANSMRLRDGSQVISGIGNNSQGNGGDVIITLRGVLSIDGTPNLDSGISQGVGAGILTRLDPGAVGQGGNITIDADSVILTSGAQLSAGTRGQGTAVNVSVTARDQVSLAGRSSIVSNTQGRGNAGGVTIRVGGDTINLAMKKKA